MDGKQDEGESWDFIVSACRKDDSRKGTSCAGLMGIMEDSNMSVDSADAAEMDMWTAVWL